MSSNIDLIVKRLLDPQFGSDTTERLLMGSAADAIRYLQGELAEALAKTTHLAKQEVDIRTAYGTVRADSMQLVRESKRLEREWAASEARALAAEATCDALREALGEARDEILTLYNMRGCEAEGSPEDWVGFIDRALTQETSNGG